MPRAVSIAVGLLILLGTLVFLGWLMVRSLKRSEDPAKLVVKWIITALVVGVLVFVLGAWGPSVGSAFVMPFACVLLGIILALTWGADIGSLLSRPLTSMFDGGSAIAEPEPLYSIALAKRKKGQAREALWEIQQELAKSPQDYTGQMLTAEIQAEDLHDLEAAVMTVQRLCDQPGHSPAGLADALNRLADWHVKFAQDTASARLALEQILTRLPDTPQAHAAHQRLAHLDGAELVSATRERRPVVITSGETAVVAHPGPASLAPMEPPEETTRKLVQHLEEFPHDDDAREKLAVLYARHYQRLDLAALELEQLIAQPNAPARRTAHWLNLLADLQLEFTQDEDAARQTLQRLIDRFPQHADAELARQRQGRLKLELRKTEVTRVVKLGTYAQDLGLTDPGRRLPQ